MLARLARADEALLGPVKHGSEEAQRDFLQIKLRDNLVRQRVNIETFSLVCYNYREEFNLKCSDKK